MTIRANRLFLIRGECLCGEWHDYTLNVDNCETEEIWCQRCELRYRLSDILTRDQLLRCTCGRDNNGKIAQRDAMCPIVHKVTEGTDGL